MLIRSLTVVFMLLCVTAESGETSALTELPVALRGTVETLNVLGLLSLPSRGCGVLIGFFFSDKGSKPSLLHSVHYTRS